MYLCCFNQFLQPLRNFDLGQYLTRYLVSTIYPTPSENTSQACQILTPSPIIICASRLSQPNHNLLLIQIPLIPRINLNTMMT